MHTILQSTGLLTMLLEQRTVPVISETNPLGYTPPRVIMVAKQNIRHDDIDDDLLSIASAASNANTEAIALQEDDYCLFQHDQARLMLLVPHVFHASLPIDKTNRSFRPFPKSPAQFKTMTEKIGMPQGMKSDVNKDGWSKAQQAELNTMIGEYDSDVKEVSFKSLRVEKRKFNSESPDLSEANVVRKIVNFRSDHHQRCDHSHSRCLCDT